MQRVPTTRGRRGRARAAAPSRDTSVAKKQRRHRRRAKRSDDGPAALTNVEKRRKRRKYDKKPQQRAAIIRKAHQQRAMLNDHVQNQMQEKSITEREPGCLANGFETESRDFYRRTPCVVCVALDNRILCTIKT